MKVLTCKICGHRNEAAQVYTAKEMMYGKRDKFDYFQCTTCECLQICELPADISAYYPSDYYSFSPYQGNKFKGFTGSINRMIYRASIFRKNALHKFIHYILPVPKLDFLHALSVTLGTRFLEVGCGNGNRILYPLAELKFKNTLGCDPFIDKPIHYSNSLTILKTDIFEINQKWDIIMYDHAFEHIENPQENLNKVSELLNSGGVCILRIPTVPCYAWSHYKTDWVQLDAPRHYFLHSPKSIEILASKAGLKLTNVQYDSTHFQFSGSEKYTHDIALVTTRDKGLSAFIKRKTKKMRYEKLAKKLNQQGKGDQAIFYLQKP